MDANERRNERDDHYLQHMRELGRRGGLATVARHGKEHMSAIGKIGFSVAMELGWGDWLWTAKLSKTYESAVGHPRGVATITVSRAQMAEVRRVRDRARRQYKDLGQCRWSGCMRDATCRHHVRGVRVDDANEHVVGYCDEHHLAVHRARRRERRIKREGAKP